jgi:hypothetical protein
MLRGGASQGAFRVALNPGNFGAPHSAGGVKANAPVLEGPGRGFRSRCRLAQYFATTGVGPRLNR